METKRNNKNQLQQIGPSYIYIINKYSPRSVMMESIICKEVFSRFVLVSSQQFTQMKTFGVRIHCQVQRITLWFFNTKKDAF